MKLLCAASILLLLFGVCLSPSLALSQSTGQSAVPAQAGSQPPQSAAPAKPAAPAPAAAKPAPTPGDLLLEAAWQAMKQHPEVSATFREQIHAPGLQYALEGRYCLLPGNKLFYERNIRLADGKGTLKSVVDGQNYWAVRSIGPDRKVQTFKFAELFKAIDQLSKEELGADKIEQIRQLARTEFSLGGFEPLLRDLHNRLTIASVAETVWKAPSQTNDQPIYLLEGTWNKAFHAQLAPPPRPGDTPSRGPSIEELWSSRRIGVNVPRSCKLFLARDGLWPFASSFWPYRIEWHGPLASGGENSLLAALEFERASPPASFEVSEEERKEAASFDPAEWVKAHQLRIQQEKKFEEERGQRRSFEGK